MFSRRNFGVLLATVAISAAAVVHAKDAVKDPFTGESWHAQAPSWPGTLRFDAGLKKVWLEPVGADGMEATYSYTLKPAAAKSKLLEGNLRMTNAQGQVSESTFTINGKELTLHFAGLQAPERYVRMTVAEQEAEKAKLQKMIKEGRIKPVGTLPN